MRAAMPGFLGKKLCPQLTIVPPDFVKYTEISRVVRGVLAEYARTRDGSNAGGQGNAKANGEGEANGEGAVDVDQGKGGGNGDDISGHATVGDDGGGIGLVTVSLDEAYLDLTRHLRERATWPDTKRTFWPRVAPKTPALVCK